MPVSPFVNAKEKIIKEIRSVTSENIVLPKKPTQHLCWCGEILSGWIEGQYIQMHLDSKA